MIYVDDVIIPCGSLQEIIVVKKYLSEVFEVTDLGEVSHFLGNLIVRNAGAVRLKSCKGEGTLS